MDYIPFIARYMDYITPTFHFNILSIRDWFLFLLLRITYFFMNYSQKTSPFLRDCISTSLFFIQLPFCCLILGIKSPSVSSHLSDMSPHALTWQCLSLCLLLPGKKKKSRSSHTPTITNISLLWVKSLPTLRLALRFSCILNEWVSEIRVFSLPGVEEHDFMKQNL